MSSLFKNRRRASRALKVMARHKDTHPALAAYEGPLGTAARTFITAHTECTAYKTQWRIEMGEGRGAMAALKKQIDIWKPHVARERPGFDLSEIGDRPTVPEDMVEDGLALADQLREVKVADGTVAPWAATAADAITAAALNAEKETDEAAAADSKHTSLITHMRESEAVFEAELIRFQASLRSLFGSSHPDFQKLRASRATTRDPDDDPTGPQPADPVTPAPTPPRT